MISFHKSSDTLRTFENKTSLDKHLAIINSNILYLTHEIDQIKLIVQKIHNTVNLKQQTLEYFGSKDLTSPQTDLEEQNGMSSENG